MKTKTIDFTILFIGLSVIICFYILIPNYDICKCHSILEPSAIIKPDTLRKQETTCTENNFFDSVFSMNGKINL